MKNKKVKKITSSFILIFMIFYQFGTVLNPVLAASIGDVVDIVSLGECGRDLLYQKDTGVITSVITFFAIECIPIIKVYERIERIVNCGKHTFIRHINSLLSNN